MIKRAHRFVASLRLRVRLASSTFIRSRHASTVYTRLTQHGQPQSSLQSAFAPAHLSLHSLNCHQPCKNTDTTMAGLCDKYGCAAKGTFYDSRMKREEILTSGRSSPKILNKPIPPSTKSSTGFVATYPGRRYEDEAHNTSIVGEEPPEALHQPHPLGKLHIASRARCARQRDAEYVLRILTPQPQAYTTP